MSASDRVISFAPFSVDLESERLWRGNEPIELRPKTWQLMRFLAENPGRLLTRDELLDVVWVGVAVTPASLNQAIRELRQALGDDARNPRYIQTVHRRGFRFIAEIGDSGGRGVPEREPTRTDRRVRTRVIGRDAELRRLRGFLAEARSGRRQVVFVTGEPGIGKTSLLREFLHRLEGDSDGETHFVGGGQCVELLGESEAYLPVLDALGRATREAKGTFLRDALRTYAPTWFAQLPWLIETGAEETPPLAGTPDRMLREFCIAMEALAAERPMILWIEDLHWCDHATVDLLSALARRGEAARLLVIATYRPVDAAMANHPIAPLKRALQNAGMCHELALELLEPGDVERIFENRFGRLGESAELSRLIHDHTDGNPLFVETTVSFLASEGLVVEGDRGWELAYSLDEVDRSLPDSLRSIVESQLHGMTDHDVLTLEAASVVGEVFDVQAVAAALQADVDDSETICGRLAGWGRFLQSEGTSSWPDGTIGGRYRFRHDVFRQILYSRTLPSLSQRLHRNVALRIEAGFEGQHLRVAAELAFHFERGGDPQRAIDFLGLAAEGVHRRFADREAVRYFQHGLDLLRKNPHVENRDRREADLRRGLARALIHASGYSSPDQRANLERLLELGKSLEDPVIETAAMVYLKDWFVLRSELEDARPIVIDDRARTDDLELTVLEAQFHLSAGLVTLLSSEHGRSLDHFASALDLLEGIEPLEIVRLVELDLGVGGLSVPAWSLWLLGRPDEARCREAAARERRGDGDGDWFGLAVILSFSLVAEAWRRDSAAAGALVQELRDCLEESGLAWPYTLAATGEGWWLAMEGRFDEALERMRRGVAEAEGAGTVLGLSVLHATIAWAEMERGEIDAARAAIDDAMRFVERTGECFWEAEIHRLRGELHRAEDDDATAELCVRRSLEVARGQSALSLELRAATSLAALLRDTARVGEAKAVLEGVYNRFGEGFGTGDLVEAKALLESL